MLYFVYTFDKDDKLKKKFLPVGWFSFNFLQAQSPNADMIIPKGSTYRIGKKIPEDLSMLIGSFILILVHVISNILNV